MPEQSLALRMSSDGKDWYATEASLNRIVGADEPPNGFAGFTVINPKTVSMQVNRNLADSNSARAASCATRGHERLGVHEICTNCAPQGKFWQGRFSVNDLK
jgi:hypothetical protein